MTPMTNWSGSQNRTAPSYGIPSRSFVSVEHPCVVKDTDKAIATLQGGAEISKLLTSTRQETSAALTLNPEDQMSKKLVSSNKQANNILLKITVPKRTGRKRKRGSQEPYQYESPPAHLDSTSTTESDIGRLDANQLLRRLQDNADKYNVEAVGRVERNHVFRGMPDFVYSTTASPFITKFRENILTFEYPKLKEFELDMRKGVRTNVDMIPPPWLSSSDVPFSYFYRQNPMVKQLVDPTGQVTTVNTQKAAKVLTHLPSNDVAVVPSKPRDECPPISTLEQSLQDTIALVKSLFSQRVAWTRRGLQNSLTYKSQKYQLRLAIPYVAYIFRSGPWRDAIIKLGHDPRTDPESRIYQTLMFRLIMPGTATGPAHGEDQSSPPPPSQTPQASSRRSTTAALGGSSTATPRPQSVVTNNPDEPIPPSHVFTGKPPVFVDAKTWMVMDITDPLLTKHIFSLPPRPTCDPGSGWYGNVGVATARAIMRAKIMHMRAHNTAFPHEEDLLPLFRFPAHVDREEDVGKLLVSENTRCVQLAAEIRTTVRNMAGMQGGRKRGEEEGAGDEEGRKRVRWEDEEGEGEEEDFDVEQEEQEQEQEDGDETGEMFKHGLDEEQGGGEGD